MKQCLPLPDLKTDLETLERLKDLKDGLQKAMVLLVSSFDFDLGDLVKGSKEHGLYMELALAYNRANHEIHLLVDSTTTATGKTQ